MRPQLSWLGCLQLVPLLVLVLQHQRMRVPAELLRRVAHPLGTLLQLVQFVTSLHGQLMGAT